LIKYRINVHGNVTSVDGDGSFFPFAWLEQASEPEHRKVIDGSLTPIDQIVVDFRNGNVVTSSHIP